MFTSRCWLSVTAQHESHSRTLRSARDLDTWSHGVKKLTLAWLTHISHFYRFNNIILLLILRLSGFANHLLWEFFFRIIHRVTVQTSLWTSMSHHAANSFSWQLMSNLIPEYFILGRKKDKGLICQLLWNGKMQTAEKQSTIHRKTNQVATLTI